MAELNLKQITDKLNLGFQGDVRKLIFWYDSNAAFQDEVDSLELNNAKVLHLESDNQFYIKHFLECVDTTTNYLVYASFEKPSIRDNHLADTLHYSQEFSTDLATLIASDLGMSEELKPVLQHYSKFFASKERTQKFYDLEIERYSRSTVEVGLLSILCKNKTCSFDEVLRVVFTEEASDASKLLDEFESYDLLNAFWEQVDVCFGYADEAPTIQKLAMTMFITYAAKAIHESAPASWAPFISCKAGSIIVFLDNLMNNYLYSERFDEISEAVYRTIKGQSTIGLMAAESLLDCHLFADVDRILIRWMIERLQNEDIGARADGKYIPEICKMRRKLHFGPKFRSEYFAVENAYYIIAEGKYLPISGVNNIAQNYIRSDFKIDTRYRYFYYYLDQIETGSAFEALRELVENIYTNEFLNKITVNWNTEFATDDCGLPLQREFFSRYLNSSKERTVVIISDALRYEVAHTLFEKLQEDEKCVVSIGAMQGVLPSYTPLGMAALLPHKRIEYTDAYDVLVDGKPCVSTEQRQIILQQYRPNSKCIQFDSLKNLKQAELRSIFTGQDIVYIYHNQIDARGDAAKTENEVFVACEEAIEEIHGIIRRISSLANTHHFFVTADHGFIYKRDRLNASDKISGISSASSNIGQRYAISEDVLEASSVCSTTIGKVLGLSDSRVVSYPLGSDIFKVGGAGQNFVHGGCSPQELIVPLVEVKVERGKKETSSAQIVLASPLNKITNLFVTLDFLQTAPISDIVKEAVYRINFISENNEIISNEILCAADKKTPEAANRIFRVRFNLKNQKYYNNQKYYLVAYDNDTGIEVLRHDVLIDIAFADDYGF